MINTLDCLETIGKVWTIFITIPLIILILYLANKSR